ncbi:MAG: DNA gyrase inhibitor YacG [Paracoccaceae bacterium]
MSCPICQKPTDPAYRPFCSKRCADIDLGRWMTGSYRLPVNEEEEERSSDAADTEGPARPH